METKNMRDLGYANGWSKDSLENRLIDIAHEAGYHFVVTSHNPRGTDTVYECKEAGLKYHVDSSD